MERTSHPRTAARVALCALATTATLFAGPLSVAGAQSDAGAPLTEPAPRPRLAWTGPELRKGDSGAEVFLMQIQLVLQGFWVSDRPGYFGESTRNAVVATQKYFHQERTGVLNPFTRFVLAARDTRVPPRVMEPGVNMDVDLGRQLVIRSDSGKTTWIFNVSTGARSTPTPPGRYHISRQINGLRISDLGRLWRPKYFNGGIAFHGSNSIPNYPASHGCVRFPNVSINFIWDAGLAPVGTGVTVL